MSHNRLSNLLPDQIPDYVQEFYPLFVIFVTSYFNFLESSSDSVQATLQDLQLNRDIDTTANELAVEFLNTYMPNLPDETAGDPALLIKHFRDFYTRKGSEKSFRLFFRAFYDDEVNITYPRNYMFSPSEGAYYVEHKLRVIGNKYEPHTLKNTRISGVYSGASAVVSDVIAVTGVGDPIGKTTSTAVLNTSFATITGTVSINSSSTLLVGNSTLFTTELTAGQQIYLDTTSVANRYTIQSIASNTSLTLTSAVATSYLNKQAWYVSSYTTYVTSNVTYYDLVLQANQIVGTSIPDSLLFDLVVQQNTIQGEFIDEEPIAGVGFNSNGTSSQVSLYLTNVIDISSGRYLNTRSHLSSDQVLQDSYYYQQFSYVINSGANRDLWADTILKHLHPTGRKMFNNHVVRTNADVVLHPTTLAETTVKIPTIRSFLTNPTFTFDRVADNITGTSDTQIATSTGFTTVTYTTSNAVNIAYSTTYDYPGENVTWALQNLNDALTFTLTEATRLDGPSFDKLSATLSLDQQIIAYPFDCNTSLVTTKYITGTSNLTAGTYLTSFSSGVMKYSTPLSTATSVGSMILLATWVKNSRGNNANGESANAIAISFSSNATVRVYFGDETQRNLKRVALGDSLDYNKLIYFHSSNSVQSALTPDTLMSSNLTGIVVFKPYNWERGQSYDRCAIRFEVDQPLQLNTSMTETFSTANITALGLVASWSSTAGYASINSFGGTTSNTLFAFSSNAFVFNGVATSSLSRFVRTIEFTSAQVVNVSLDYLVGDDYNGGESPDGSEDLELQYSTNGGSTWFTYTKIWQGSSSNLWTYGTTSLAGKIIAEPGSTVVTGVGTLFSTQVNVGDRFTINSATTTAYTVTGITNNNLMTITPPFVNYFRGYVATTGLSNTGKYGDTVSGVSTLYNSELKIGSRVSLSSSNSATSYLVVNVIDDSTFQVTPTFTESSTNITVYLHGGVDGFYKKPASLQWATTSITAYGPGPVTSITLRVVQLSQTALNNDVYAIDNLRVDSLRYQATTGVVNVGIRVSSNSTLSVNDNDFFTITTLGIV